MNNLIIDNKNNNFNNNNSFQNKINANITNNENTDIRKVLSKDIFSINGGNTNNDDAMYDKSLAMLNDRLQKGTISLEEFNKKCNIIANKRNK